MISERWYKVVPRFIFNRYFKAYSSDQLTKIKIITRQSAIFKALCCHLSINSIVVQKPEYYSIVNVFLFCFIRLTINLEEYQKINMKIKVLILVILYFYYIFNQILFICDAGLKNSINT
ncbi:hypothetical protein XIS1_320007 [Xenorhabdus innexi]|uniref:Uncharacterized protein n=1 Tax=Xenorhabdus innexi TaxID=290109 RepID=A0A1N6MXQ5_9GAMM|nr:hypothetical protein XIS1_320007 [Xenorhabdus innexi]